MVGDFAGPDAAAGAGVDAADVVGLGHVESVVLGHSSFLHPTSTPIVRCPGVMSAA